MINEKLKSGKVPVFLKKRIEMIKLLLEILLGIEIKLVFGAIEIFIHT